MSYKKGIVQGVVVREPKEGKFGKFSNYALKIDDVYYNSIASEHNGEIKVQDSTYALIKEGCEVEFMYSTNDKGYHDIDKKTLKVTGGRQEPTKPVSDTAKQQAAPVEASAISAHIWVECLKAAVNTLQVLVSSSPTDHFEVTPEKIIQLADKYFNKAIQ
jgi:hypothetical protein